MDKMNVCERVKDIDEYIANEYAGNMHMESTYYAGLAIAAAIQEQTEVIRELKDKISDIVQYNDDIYGREYGALTITGGLNTYEQN